ncbi:hypothetical protein TNIN_282541 [Trichonephila inaurata madagascariensis]|uniref:Uncharacterized protein n=1 Tax=Trichonephila inaurata madagascariensis TaxID=2747483 RepID=A0A8X6YE07_9ARAC|nr:hypothetical protein TNIN_282541 [Trichonephila inaurata madagascariensis]
MLRNQVQARIVKSKIIILLSRILERRCPTKVITAREGERAGDRSSTAKFLGDSQKENVLRHVYSTNSVLVFFPFPSMKLFFLHGPRCLRATSSFYD